jgi:hypothetical protein
MRFFVIMVTSAEVSFRSWCRHRPGSSTPVSHHPKEGPSTMMFASVFAVLAGLLTLPGLLLMFAS